MARIQYAYSQIRKRYIWQQWFCLHMLVLRQQDILQILEAVFRKGNLHQLAFFY